MIPLWLLSAFGFVKKAAGAVLSLATRYPVQCALIASLVATAWLWRANGHLRDGIKVERAAHSQTVAGYKAASAEAKAIQDRNLTRVAKEQTAITERVSHDYQTRIAAARADADKLRQSRNSLSDRSGGVPATGEGPTGTLEAPGDGFPLAKRLIAQEIAIQLDELITWVEAQSAVATSPEPGGR